MLSYIKTAVTRNASEKKINSTLDFISASTDVKLLQDFYGATLNALADAKNERLWFKTNLKLCGLWFKLQEYGRTAKILKELHRWVRFLRPPTSWTCTGKRAPPPSCGYASVADWKNATFTLH